MRIAIYWEQDSWGGVDTHLLTLLRDWPAATDEFVVFFNRGNLGLERIKAELSALPNVQLREVVSFSYNEMVRRLAVLPMGRWLRLFLYPLQPLLLLLMANRLANAFAHNGRFDLMLADNGGYPAAWGAQSAVIGAKRAGVGARLLLVHHSSTPPALFMGWYERLVDRAMERISSAIVCVSYATRQSLLDTRMISVSTARLRVIHNGISASPAARDHAPSYNLREAVNAREELIVGIVGRVQAYKGHEDLIFALARLAADERRRLKLVVLGSGDAPEMARLQALVERCGVVESVHFAGYVPGDPVELIGQLDLLVIATRSFEGFGLTLAEAMLAGTPILTTRVGAIPEFVNESNGVLVNPGSPLEMSMALKDFIANREAWRARAKVAQKRMQSEGNLMPGEYHRLFEECIAGSLG